MPKLRAFFLILAFSSDVSRAVASPVSAPEFPFMEAEELKYEASWAKFIQAGEVKVQAKGRRVFDGIERYHLRLEAQSVGIVKALIYDINDVYESYVDVNTLLPFHTENHWQHGNQREKISVKIDQSRRTARLGDGSLLKIPPQTYDLVSLLYAIRRMDLTPGATHRFSLLENNELYTVSAEPEASERISTRIAAYETVRIGLRQVEAGKIKDSYKLRLYLSKDLRRLPVLITAEPEWGQIRLELTLATGTDPNRKSVP